MPATRAKPLTITHTPNSHTGIKSGWLDGLMQIWASSRIKSVRER